MNNPKPRNELKYLVTDVQIALIEPTLRSLMQSDQNAGPKGQYVVRSLYFDDLDGISYMENENGTEPREKFRLRIYDGSPSYIRLELKQKVHGKCIKHICPITEAQCRELMAGRILENSTEYPPVLNKLLLKMKTTTLGPECVVQYHRQPFVLPNSDLRVTLDKGLCSSPNTALFLQQELPLRPVLPTGRHLMEIKYDHYLPGFLSSALSIGHLSRTTFSKYYLCRKYSLKGTLK